MGRSEALLKAPTSFASLPRPAMSASRATPKMYLASPMKTLAHAIEPSRFIIECGGDGQCGPNTLGFLLGLADLAEVDGPQLRFAVAAHASKPQVQNRVSSVATSGGLLTVRELILLNVSHWPTAVLGDLPPTVESWCRLIVIRHTWTDVAFTQLVADLYNCAIHMLGVGDLSQVWNGGTFSPGDKHRYSSPRSGCHSGRQSAGHNNPDQRDLATTLSSK